MTYDYLVLNRLIFNDAEALMLKDKYYPEGGGEGVSTHLQKDLITETHFSIALKDKNLLAQAFADLYSEFYRTNKSL